MIPILLAALTLQQPVTTTELADRTLLFATPAGNVVATIQPEGAFLVGALSAAATPAIQAEIGRRTSSPVRYVMAAPHATAGREGDAGWRATGAFVITQEQLWARMEERVRPTAAFDQFIKFRVGAEEPHCVRQQPGYSNSDVLVHFEHVNVVYLGESFAGDGYPAIDSAQGGTLEGLIQTLNPWTGGGRSRFVGAHGPAVGSAEIRAFRDMLTTMRDRVRSLVQAGRSVDQVIAERPSREFDARYGAGRVTPEAFVRTLYEQVSRSR